jgi:uncharacterized membrane protein
MNNPVVSEWLNLIFRWAHVVAGVMWIGHLWFFNFVNAQLAKTYDADSKKKVIPELMPRALYWFRWGAAWTWITGVLLLGIIYTMGAGFMREGSTLSNGAGTGIAFAVLFAGFLVYDLLWKSPIKANPVAGAIVSVVLLAASGFVLDRLFAARTTYILLGGLLGTIMAANVWMRIWPAQRKIIAAVKGGSAPDPALVALAGLRSKHNTYMSVPLMFLMVSNHFPGVYGMANGWAVAVALVVVSFAFTAFLYSKSASAAAAKF